MSLTLHARTRPLPSRAVNVLLKKLLLSLLVVATVSLPAALRGAEPDVVTAAEVPSSPTNEVEAANALLLRNFLLLQDQLHATQRAVEQARDEAQTDSKRTAELMAARLNLIEQTLNTQRTEEMDSLRRSSRTMLVVVGMVTGLGFLAVVFAGFVQIRAMTRLVEISHQLHAALPAPRPADLAVGALATGRDQVELSNAHLLGAIDRLQKRLDDLEAASSGTHTATNGHDQIVAPMANTRVMTILGKGQTLLNLDQPEQALEHFEEALNIDPKNVEAWIKKGTALERLQRIDEAVAAYDQAIAADTSTATAYLFKAGVYNRQKKYAEALQCYEQALTAQQKSRSTQAAGR